MSENQIREMNDRLARIRDAITKETQCIELLYNQSNQNTIQTIKVINDLLKSQQETELAKAYASVAAKGQQFFEEERIITTEKSVLEEQIEKIVEHYLGIQKKLDEELEARIRRIGEYIFRIVEEEGENLITQVSTLKRDALSDAAATIKEIYANKIQILQNSLSSASSNFDSLIKQRENMVTNIQSLLINKTIDKPVNYFVPFWIVETEDLKTQEVKKTVYGPTNFQFHPPPSEDLKPIAEPMNGYSSLEKLFVANLEGITKNLVKSRCGYRKSAEEGINSLITKGLLNQKIAELILKEKRLMDFVELGLSEGGIDD